MVLSIWCGKRKPNNLNSFLKPFVDELKQILSNGIIVNGFQIKLLLRAFICDSPARSFIKGSIFDLLNLHR